HSCSQWRLQAELLVDVVQTFDGKVELSIPELDSKQTFQMRFLQGRFNYNFTLNINQVLKAILSRLLDLNQVFFRTVELVQEPVVGSPGLSFYFRVNGRDVFLKGSNWIPAHSFQDQLKKLAALHCRRQHERPQGLGRRSVWQDFMFACAMYPTEDDFIQTVREEVAQQVSETTDVITFYLFSVGFEAVNRDVCKWEHKEWSVQKGVNFYLSSQSWQILMFTPSQLGHDDCTDHAGRVSHHGRSLLAAQRYLAGPLVVINWCVSWLFSRILFSLCTEFGGKWKMLHYFAQNFFAPVLPVAFEDDDTLFVYAVSDLNRGLKLRAVVRLQKCVT
ncbi:hypothetical protein GOODEAATRI_024512, partial [Goodea atripinnis]